MQKTPQAPQTADWDAWLDDYISEKMPELTVREDAEKASAADHSGGWYTGKRKNGAKRRPVVLPSEEEPKPEEQPEPEKQPPVKEKPAQEKKPAPKKAAPKKPEGQPSGGKKPAQQPAQKQKAKQTAPKPQQKPVKKTPAPAPQKKAPKQAPPAEQRPAAPTLQPEESGTPLEYRTITIPMPREQVDPQPETAPVAPPPRVRKPMRGFYEPEQVHGSPEEERLKKLTGGQFRSLITKVGAGAAGLSAVGCVWSAVQKQAVPAILMLLVTLLTAALLYLVNQYFTKSIVEPITAITETTRRIADGSYGVQIEKTYPDEIGELAESINDMSKKISEAERMKSEFISSVSHELRTPLTAINGWGETLLSGQMTDQRDEQKGLSIIVSEARRLTKMVEELLEFSRIEDGRFVLRMEQIDIKAELEDSVYTYREFFRKKGIDLEYHDCEEEFPPIPGDPERLKQVFVNLMDNAAKHGGSGRKIIVSIFPDNAYVAIRIRDYGPGIPPEELPHVKTKFYKGSSKARGSGIGLAVCDEIAIRHNGSLEIGNAAGGGCVVTLRLPIHAES